VVEWRMESARKSKSVEWEVTDIVDCSVITVDASIVLVVVDIADSLLLLSEDDAVGKGESVLQKAVLGHWLSGICPLQWPL
jgi:hypothetical protein